jgi:hypothetical protein
MNRPEISSTLRFSLKCRICRTSTPSCWPATCPSPSPPAARTRGRSGWRR